MQLEAYAFALENPAKDAPIKVSTAGLLVWSPVKVRGNSSGNFGLELSCNWFPTARSPELIAARLSDFIKMITGPVPAAKSNCDQCKYIDNRVEILKGV